MAAQTHREAAGSQENKMRRSSHKTEQGTHENFEQAGFVNSLCLMHESYLLPLCLAKAVTHANQAWQSLRIARGAPDHR